jgi:hypothetical protein
MGASNPSFCDVDDEMERRGLEACTEFKNMDTGGDVHLYSIAASTAAGPGTSVYQLLSQCATDEDHFFYANNASALEEAFDQIAKDATNLHITQ